MLRFSIAALLLAGCSSASFTVAPAEDSSTPIDSGGDTSATGDSSVAPDTGIPVDSSVVDAIDDAIVVDGGSDASGCSVPAGNATDLYVDAKSTKPETGSADCPFHTIVAATKLAYPSDPGVPSRTIHVKGSSSGTTYAETSAVEIAANVRVIGDGPTLVKIRNGGPCPLGGGNCIVQVDAGGVLQGVSVGGSAYPAIVTNVGLPAAAISNVVVSNCTNLAPGIQVHGPADLGPSISSINNAGHGVDVIGGAGGPVHVITDLGLVNNFDQNGGSGINLSGAQLLFFDGGTATGNVAAGIRLVGTALTNAAHQITGLTAASNGTNGVFVGGGVSLILRKSTLLKNKVGLTFIAGNASYLDVGASDDLGGNVFGGATSTNTLAGLCIDGAKNAITAAGDSWSACPPTFTLITGTCDAPSTTLGYRDYLQHAVGTGTSPVLDTGGSCTVGP